VLHVSDQYWPFAFTSNKITQSNVAPLKSTDFNLIPIVAYCHRHRASDKAKLSLMRAFQRPKDKSAYISPIPKVPEWLAQQGSFNNFANWSKAIVARFLCHSWAPCNFMLLLAPGIPGSARWEVTESLYTTVHWYYACINNFYFHSKVCSFSQVQLLQTIGCGHSDPATLTDSLCPCSTTLMAIIVVIRLWNNEW